MLNQIESLFNDNYKVVSKAKNVLEYVRKYRELDRFEICITKNEVYLSYPLTNTNCFMVLAKEKALDLIKERIEYYEKKY